MPADQPERFAELHRMTLGEREFLFTGCDRAKGRFLATALRAARRQSESRFGGAPESGAVVQAMRVVAPRLKSIVCTHGVEVWEPLSGCGGERYVMPASS